MKEELIRLIQNLDDYHTGVVLALVKKLLSVGEM